MVILTHAHIDHIGGVERFRNARIFVQQKEFEAWERMATVPRYAQVTLPAAMPRDYPEVRKMIDEGVVTLLNGDVINFLPDIDLHVVYNCHSVAEQIVVVHNDDASSDDDSTHTLVNEQGDRVSIEMKQSNSSNKITFLVAGDLATRPANLVGIGNWHAYLAPIRPLPNRDARRRNKPLSRTSQHVQAARTNRYRVERDNAINQMLTEPCNGFRSPRPFAIAANSTI